MMNANLETMCDLHEVYKTDTNTFIRIVLIDFWINTELLWIGVTRGQRFRSQ